MKDEYDFSNAKRGPVIPSPAGKTRITIRLDDDVLQWFKAQVHKAGGGNYQTLMNHALREYMDGINEPLEDVLRRVLREELGNVRDRMRTSTDALPDVRDGLSRKERVVLRVLRKTQAERNDRNVPTAMLWGRVCEYFYISPEDLSVMLARLGAMQQPGGPASSHR